MTAARAALHTAGMDERGSVLAFPTAPEAIELRHLRAFVAVAEELNFGRAATRLYVSQPALSRQIRGLERLVGCELLRRSTHRVELTIAGEALLDRARTLLEDLDDAISATRSVGGELVGRVEKLWQPITELAEAGAGLAELRAAYEEMHAQFPLPTDLQVRPENVGGVHALSLTFADDAVPTLLYLHGGGYVLGSAFGYRHLAGALAAAADTGALALEYRLAPEHPYPAALDDAVRAYEWMLERGTPASQIVVAGDSSGGGLSMSLLLACADRGLPAPAGALLLCPGVDLTLEHLERADHPDRALTIKNAMASVEAYLAGHSLDDPLVNPLAADLSGLPPLLVQVATGDIARHEAQALVDHARAHGVDARLELYPIDVHVFQLFWSFLPEAADALQHAGAFVAEVTRRDAARAAG